MDNVEEIRERLLRLDEDAGLLFDDDSRFVCILVGGSAMILLGFLSRATHDIDVLQTPPELLRLLEKYDMNINVSAHMDNFPDDYPERVHRVELDTQKIDYYTLSLEDRVISKLAAGRPKDIHDITEKSVIDALDWIQLEESAEMVKAGMLSDRSIAEFMNAYASYVGRYRP